eukprot:TRINITY_DN18297_c0_g1_i2.p1 TRINITY_DN18297_c0_g1~~TRINITY_DN18297_c0_g1_i2.p1  ORF type:complete len:446 (-),score=75.49 TRINITY_DN18297_c0_g1_i2:112-1449(-)
MNVTGTQNKRKMNLEVESAERIRELAPRAMKRPVVLYSSNHVEDLRQRQIGILHPTAFARQIGGTQDLIHRLKLYATLEAHDGCVNTVQFNPEGNRLVSGSDDRQVIFWDWDAKTKVFAFNSGHSSNVFQAKVMPFTDDHCVVTCAADGQVRRAQILENGNVETKRLAKHRGRTHKLALEPGSPHVFYSCGEDGAVQRFDLRDDSATKLFTCHPFRGNNNKSQSSLPVRLNAITINPRNPIYFAIGGSDEYARVYDIRSYKQDASEDNDCPVDTFVPQHLIDNSNVHITGLVYSNQNELLVSYNDELIYLFCKEMGLGTNPKLIPSEKRNELASPQVYSGHRNARTVKGVNFFGPNTEYVVSGSDCGRIFIWKKKGGELLHLMVGDQDVVNCLEPHPYATVLATSGIDSSVKVWTPTAEDRIPLPDNIEEVGRILTLLSYVFNLP